MTYIFILPILILIFIIWSSLEQRIIVRSRYNIRFPSLGANKQGLSLVLLSDLHNKSFGKNNKRLLKKILEEKPDFVIIAGDMITKKKPCYPGNAYNLIRDISEHYPVYYALGNHEQAFEDLEHSYNSTGNKADSNLYESWLLYKEKIRDLGVHLLDNKSIMLQYKDIKLTITGLSLSLDYYSKGRPLILEQNKILNKIGYKDRENYHILIAHNPIYFKDYIQWGADLILSGHVHGGMVRIPFIGGIISPQVRLFPKYDGGQYCENKRHMIVSRGLGSHSFMPRFLNPPDLIVINFI